jgi:hypothetical protein
LIGEYKAAVLLRVVIWTKGHSQKGLRLSRELIGNWGIESTVTLDIRREETLNPESEEPWLGEEDHAGIAGLVDQVF